MRAACETLVEELLFNKVVQRYQDDIKISKLRLVPWDDGIVMQINDLYGVINDYINSHSRSDLMREEPLEPRRLVDFLRSFDNIASSLKNLINCKREELKHIDKKRPW